MRARQMWHILSNQRISVSGKQQYLGSNDSGDNGGENISVKASINKHRQHQKNGVIVSVWRGMKTRNGMVWQ